jgi:hypothetical protein
VGSEALPSREEEDVNVKAMTLVPYYWGPWWIPAKGNSYNWGDLNAVMARVVGGRYMDGLNQYGIGRGSISKTYVHRDDPPATGFTDGERETLLRTAMDDGRVPRPEDFDLETQQPFYCVIVKPGVEHLRDAKGTPDTGTGAFHFGLNYVYPGFSHEPASWQGQACWVKAAPTVTGTVQRWVHEMAEAYSAGKGEIADLCQSKDAVIVDGVAVPQYWSVSSQTCWPPSDTRGSTAKARKGRSPLSEDKKMTSVTRMRSGRVGPPLSD